MKLLFSFGILLATSISMFAAEPFVTPDFVKELKDLDAVKSQAASENKAVSFLLMEPGST